MKIKNGLKLVALGLGFMIVPYEVIFHALPENNVYLISYFGFLAIGIILLVAGMRIDFPKKKKETVTS